MAELMDHVRVLADQIGPRPVSTEEEHQTSLYVAQELTDLGLEVDVDEFATPTGVRWPYALAFLAITLGTIISGIGIFVPGIALSMFVVGIVLIAAGVFVYYTEHNNKPFLSKMRAGGVSQNVVAKYVPSSVARESRRRKVIIVAHVDTVRAQPENMPALIKQAPLLRKILYYDVFAILGIAIIRLLPLPWPEVVDLVLWVLSLIGCVYAILAALCIVAQRFMPYISGGNDNASSVAVLLAVARRLLDPEERERYAVEYPIEQDLDVPVEMLVQPTGSFAPVGADDEYEMYGEDAVYDERFAPEGADLEYADEAQYRPVYNEEGELIGEELIESDYFDELDDAQEAVSVYDEEEEWAEEIPQEQADEAAYEGEETYEAESEEGAEPESYEGEPYDEAAFEDAPEEGEYYEGEAYEDEYYEDEEVYAEEEYEAPRYAEPEPIEDDGATWRDFVKPISYQFHTPQPGDDDYVEELPVVEDAAQETSDEVELGGHWPSADEYVEVEPEPAASEPVYPAPKQEAASNVPSWYTAAKARAAREAEAAAQSEVASKPTQYRSRFADMPLRGGIVRPESEVEPDAEAEAPAEEEFTFDTGEFEALENGTFGVRNAEEPVATPDVVPVAAEDAPKSEDLQPLSGEEVASISDFEIPDDELDDITPDSSGMFYAVQVPAAQASAAGPQEPKRSSGLTSRIPVIGASSGLQDGAHAAPAPAPSDKTQVVPPVKPAAERAPKPAAERRKPTARQQTGTFRAIKGSEAREREAFRSYKQEAPVSSTYESTPQSAPQAEPVPEHDPFEPKSYDRAEQSAARASRPSSRRAQASSRRSAPTAASGASTPFPSVSSRGAEPSPGATSSFPSLTGSFPALSGRMPTISADDFASDGRPAVGSGDAIESFVSSGPSSEIDMPESRFHSAMDKVGGLFGKKRKGDNEIESGWTDDEDDDFGWKGGAYLDESESAFAAAKQRAAEIRDSVIQMTESDLLDKEVWFVALGASGAGNQGMKNFLDLHSSELRGALIVNLEAVGAGDIHFVDVEGTGKPHKSDRRLQKLVRTASKELTGHDMKPAKLDWRSTDATPAMQLGMRALTIMGFDGAAPVNWHWTGDTADIVDPDNLEYTTRLLLKMIENS